jgi:uncharacterized protein YdiU (UPF0061 family)
MTHPLDHQTTRLNWDFDNSYCQLPSFFFARQSPVPVRDPKLVLFNHSLSEELGLSFSQTSEQLVALELSGNQIPLGAEPIAQAYAGHQFGHFAILGDGRAILLGEHLSPEGKRFDVQLKGAGQTPFSRRGDGRAALAPMLREYIISEAMHALGIPTTRSLAVVTTGQPVYRETSLPGAVLTRIAASHIRVGTFEYTNAQGDQNLLQALADYTWARHYPDCANAQNPYLCFLETVMDRQASLIARWQLVGFIHGVMNTDNMSIAGETIDYGPCAFMDTYHADTVFSSIDQQGRYAYGNQPLMAQWNLARFTEALLPLLNPDETEALALGRAAVHHFPERFQRYWLSGMRAKLGLFTEEPSDKALIETLLSWMQNTAQDFTHTFRSLGSESLANQPFFQDAAFTDWHSAWQARLSRQPQTPEEVLAHMNAHNPAIIPRNYHVEEALRSASEENDLTRLHQLLAALKQPYTERPEFKAYQMPPPPSPEAYRTFCGT